jgi:hypothetical protein
MLFASYQRREELGAVAQLGARCAKLPQEPDTLRIRKGQVAEVEYDSGDQSGAERSPP